MSPTQKNIFAIVTAVLIIGGTIFLMSGRTSTPREEGAANNVSVSDGIQVITITAKGGYQPRKSTAKAGIPTVLRFNTKGTFDCSASVRIPSLNVTKILPQSGSADIDIGSAEVGTLQGSCGMGMYPFEIEFQS